MKRKTKITLETERYLIINRSDQAAKGWCHLCNEEVRMLRPEEAATVAGVTARTIYRWVEAGKIHFKETDAGFLLVCFNSLTASGNDEKD